MVVSGLPETNEGRHIVEICNMALDLIDEVFRFKIRHRSDEKLKLRVGIHSGPCAAGKLKS
jgi:class 3 adenylate cyclase